VEDTESPVDWAQIVLARSNNYLIVDTETTGVDALGEVLEIAIIDLTGRVLMEQHFRPESMEEIPEVARSLTGLTMADLQDKPAFHEVYSRIVEMTKGKTILAYNAEFDQRLLLQTCLKYDLAPLANSWDCVMLKYSEYVGEWSEYHGNFQYQKLPTEKKGALEGCLACLDVVQKMAGGMRVS
jgi:DNA polymerase-3 subunit epsilon